MPKRVLIVEDEATISGMLADMLEALGYSVAGIAPRVEQAMEMAQSADIDMAILDVNLDGQPSFPIADALQARGVPFFFTTGYGTMGIDIAYTGCLVLRKPFMMKDLQAALDAVTA